MGAARTGKVQGLLAAEFEGCGVSGSSSKSVDSDSESDSIIGTSSLNAVLSASAWSSSSPVEATESSLGQLASMPSPIVGESTP